MENIIQNLIGSESSQHDSWQPLDFAMALNKKKATADNVVAFIKYYMNVSGRNLNSDSFGTSKFLFGVYIWAESQNIETNITIAKCLSEYKDPESLELKLYSTIDIYGNKSTFIPILANIFILQKIKSPYVQNHLFGTYNMSNNLAYIERDTPFLMSISYKTTSLSEQKGALGIFKNEYEREQVYIKEVLKIPKPMILKIMSPYLTAKLKDEQPYLTRSFPLVVRFLEFSVNDEYVLKTIKLKIGNLNTITTTTLSMTLKSLQSHVLKGIDSTSTKLLNESKEYLSTYFDNINTCCDQQLENMVRGVKMPWIRIQGELFEYSTPSYIKMPLKTICNEATILQNHYILTAVQYDNPYYLRTLVPQNAETTNSLICEAAKQIKSKNPDLGILIGAISLYQANLCECKIEKDNVPKEALDFSNTFFELLYMFLNDLEEYYVSPEQNEFFTYIARLKQLLFATGDALIYYLIKYKWSFEDKLTNPYFITKFVSLWNRKFYDLPEEYNNNISIFEEAMKKTTRDPNISESKMSLLKKFSYHVKDDDYDEFYKILEDIGFLKVLSYQAPFKSKVLNAVLATYNLNNR